MGLRAPKVLENDAIVVLVFMDLGPTMRDSMTHHQFKTKAFHMGFDLTKSQVHNMLHRAKGRVATDGRVWQLTTPGLEYRTHVLSTLRRLAGAPPLDNRVTAK